MSDFPTNPDHLDNHSAPDPNTVSIHCPAIRTVEVGIGEKVLIASDFFIKPSIEGSSSTSDQYCLERFIAALNRWDGPGTVIIAGNLLDFLTHSVDSSTAPDSPLFQAFRSLINRASVQIFVLPGFRDSRLAYDTAAAANLRRIFPFELALEIDLQIETIGGFEKVRVTAGREFDPITSAKDPYSPVETPWAQHLLADFWPRYQLNKKSKWLHGVERLRDPIASVRFVISRITYQKAVRVAPWILLPLVLSFLVKIPIVISLPVINRLRYHAVGLGSRLAYIGAATIIDSAVLLIAILILLRISYSRFVSEESENIKTSDINVNARLGAAKAIENGYAGLIAGHFLTPELSRVGDGFFACTGSVSRVYVEAPAALGLPAIFRPRNQVTWIEIDVGAALHVRLLSSSSFAKADSLVEQLLISKRKDKTFRTGQLASFPDGSDYREDQLPVVKQVRSRRIASAAIFIIGALDLASALTPPIRSRLHFIQEFLPVTITTTASALVAMASIGLMFLAGGVRRGQRQAWTFALVLSIGAATLNLLKGGDFEEALALLILALYLVSKRNSFKAPSDRPSLRRGVRALVLGAAAIIVFSTSIVYGYITLIKHNHSFSYWYTFIAVSERMAGFSSHFLPGTIDQFAAPALALSGLCLVTIALFLAFRPVVDRSVGLSVRFGARSERERARAIVGRYSTGTLDYFALRDDKRYFFAHGCLVAYANYGSVALVSPDPVGPDTTKEQAWKEFLTFANAKGWIVGVLGADEAWLDSYQATGMHSVYVGDEAIVAVKETQLEGKKNKGLRQAVGRIRKYGYAVEFHDPSRLNPQLKAALMSVMSQSRKGEAERGFSMTLGRVFDPSDKHLLLTVCKDHDGSVVGFCQWVPAPGINGYSLDLMRRDLGTHPNGLMDFMIVSTIEYLASNGYEHLSLNFATMRAVLSGEMGSVTQRVEKWFLQRMGDSMQIESLWRFNSKFDPHWHPRYVIYDNAEHAPAILLAIARAEALWELPIIGRFLNPADSPSNP